MLPEPLRTRAAELLDAAGVDDPILAWTLEEAEDYPEPDDWRGRRSDLSAAVRDPAERGWVDPLIVGESMRDHRARIAGV